MILIGLGSNVPGRWGTPEQTIKHALGKLNESPCQLLKTSSLIKTPPFGVVDQPDFINAVAIIATKLAPKELMQHLHDIELQADRRRTIRWGPRTLDLDLLDYEGIVLKGEGKTVGHCKPLELPHSGIPERLFVLEPIAEIASEWKHPTLNKTAEVLIERLQK